MSTQIRPSVHETMMECAKLWSKRGTCLRKQVGCVVSDKSGRIISTGYVGSWEGEAHCTDDGCIIDERGGCVRTIHAEINAIIHAAKRGLSVVGCTLYTTVSPCKDCAEIIALSGIDTVYYDEKYRKTEAIDTLKRRGIGVWDIKEMI